MDVLKVIKPLVKVTKKRVHYKYTLPNKLDLHFNFDKCVYTSPKAKEKHKVDILEIMAENKPDEFAEIYENFIKDLILDLPTMVKTKHSDLFIGLDYLLDIRK